MAEEEDDLPARCLVAAAVAVLLETLLLDLGAAPGLEEARALDLPLAGVGMVVSIWPERCEERDELVRGGVVLGGEEEPGAGAKACPPWKTTFPGRCGALD